MREQAGIERRRACAVAVSAVSVTPPPTTASARHRAGEQSPDAVAEHPHSQLRDRAHAA